MKLLPQYLQVSISAEDQSQADNILHALLKRRLVTGGQIISAPARFLWKGKIVDMHYCTILSYTVSHHKQAIIAQVKETSVEEVPMVTFTLFDGNQELLDWISDTVG